MLKNLLLIGVVFSTFILNAQVTCVPVFPGPDESVMITFNANEGNKGLASETGDIYAHTGIITDASTSLKDWKRVKFPWNVNDPSVRMTAIGNGLYTLNISNIRSFYGALASEKILKLAFVFRNANGTKEGKTAGGEDILYDVYSAGSALKTLIIAPISSTIFTTVGQNISFKGAASLSSNLTLTDNESVIATASAAKELTKTIDIATEGAHRVTFKAETGGNVDSASFTYVVPFTLVAADPPAGSELGANIKGDSVTLLLQAPNKDNVFVIGSFTDYKVDSKYQMRKSIDGKTWWVTIKGLTLGKTYTYQYLVDGLPVADPLSTLVLDPNNDNFISSLTYPNPIPYPTNKTTGHVSVIEVGKTPYVWKNTNFARPEKKDLIIYELLMRDFVNRHDFQTLMDTISYLKNLGINAIELMPINEFEGNESWGYNPAFHNALDKYYGTPDKFKEFVDKCHENGIAVIVDIVFNQAYSQSPLFKLYSQGSSPTANSPFLNIEAPHPYSVGYDFNHESEFTKNYVSQCIKYWLREYNIDGYRFDLTKGFTQNRSTEATASNYDISRINILKNYHNVVQSTTPGAYTILEHFCENAEESELANAGMMVWANVNHDANEATMGWTGNGLSNFSAKKRGWNDTRHDKHIAYMESHDEERLMYKNGQFANGAPGYSIKNDISIALKRMELISSFFYLVPGPRMLWQFGELGYDVSIGFNERVGKKPIRWEYFTDNARKRLYNVTRNLIALRKNNTAFKTLNYTDADLAAGYLKAYHIQENDFNAIVLGNFDVVAGDITPAFQKTGKWYNYMTGDSITVTDKNAIIRLLPGEYRIYTSVKQPQPPGGYVRYTLTSTEDFAAEANEFMVYPTPSVSGNIFIGYHLKKGGNVQWSVYNMVGQQVHFSTNKILLSGSYQDDLKAPLPAGTYLVKLTVNGATGTQKIVIH